MTERARKEAGFAATDLDPLPQGGAGSFSQRPTSATIQVSRTELAPGMMVGDYQIEAKIGTGGMGEVFSAVHPLIGKRAAIKLLRAHLCRDPAAVERFIDEARVVNEIGHPNLVNVFAFGQLPDGRHFFIMEWLKGESLRARLARGPMTVSEIHAVVRPLARALAAAHDAGVVHRDLKPDNIFLLPTDEPDPIVKLLDFGIAKLAKTDHRIAHTQSGEIVGTPQYMSPEQAKGTQVDGRSDIYALGAIVFEMLTGRGPFVGKSAMELVAKHLSEAPVAPSTLAGNVPRELDDIVSRMLAKDPGARPRLEQVLEAIGSRLRTNPRIPVISPGEARPLAEDSSPASWRRRALIVAVAAAVTVAVVLGFLFARAPDPVPANARSVTEPVAPRALAAVEPSTPAAGASLPAVESPPAPTHGPAEPKLSTGKPGRATVKRPERSTRSRKKSAPAVSEPAAPPTAASEPVQAEPTGAWISPDGLIPAGAFKRPGDR